MYIVCIFLIKENTLQIYINKYHILISRLDKEKLISFSESTTQNYPKTVFNMSGIKSSSLVIKVQKSARLSKIDDSAHRAFYW